MCSAGLQLLALSLGEMDFIRELVLTLLPHIFVATHHPDDETAQRAK